MATRARRIEDYTLRDNAGRGAKLSSLFGRREHLVVVHNMGKSCPNCALWGDEFNGMLRHLERAAAFCVISPDDPRTQKRYVKQRGWRSRLYSARGTSFIRDLGFERKRGKPEPGVSVLRKKGETITVLRQVNVMKDGRAPSVLEVLWMIPGVEVDRLAWKTSRAR
jgi:predicted dithiol-disulfide oxidoreductase (DUF899 family)